MLSSRTNLARLIMVLTFCIVALLAATTAFADVGPKPTMQFKLVFQTAPVTLVGGQQIECSDAACSDAHPLAQLGPQRFSCSPGENQCSSLAYGYSRFHKLVLQFADRTRESNIFASGGGSYIVTVRDTDLAVSADQLSRFSDPLAYGALLVALLWTLFTEVPIAALYLRLRHLKFRVLIWVVVANLISVPVLWLVLPMLPLDWLAATILCELGVIVFEALWLHFTNRTILAFKESAVLSVLMNLASIFVGLVLVGVFALAIFGLTQL